MARSHEFIERVATQIVTSYLVGRSLAELTGEDIVDEAIKELDEIYHLDKLAELDEETFKAHLTVILNYYQRAEPYEIMYAKLYPQFEHLDNQQLKYLGIRIEILAKEREDAE